jgi:signal transduction histidine kinase
MNRPAFETARVELSRLRVEARGIEGALGRIARVCAQTLDVERVGVWTIDGDRLIAQALYARGDDDVRTGDTLDATALVAALRERRAIVADDAASHPAARAIAGATSVLAAPVYRRGDVVAVLCSERVGPARAWRQAEIDFASTVAEIVSTLYEQSAALALDDELSRRAARQADADRLEAITRVCAAIAHDFNNVLSMMSLASAQLSRGGEANGPDLAHALSGAVAVGQRLVGQLRSFGARPAGASVARARVADVIASLRPVIELLVREVAALDVTVETGDADAAIAPGPLEQILLNLCLNARDAIARRGRVSVRAHRTADAIAIEVGDDGAGIPPDVLPHVFEPYFTTKPTGTGLGLATVRDLVREHGGTITVDSAPGRTTFTITLPLA